jgi:hypothetical protein
MSLLFRALHEHRDRRSNALIDEHYEYLVLRCQGKLRSRRHGADLHFDNGLTQTASLVIHFLPRSELLSVSLPAQRLFRVCLSNQMYRRIYY